MTRLAIVALGAGVVALLAILFFGAGAPSGPKPVAAGSPRFALASTTVDLPTDDQQFPGADAAVANANCASCHSASMVLTQPKLKPEQWKATVTKMREIYRAPIAEADVPAILTYLNRLSASR